MADPGLTIRLALPADTTLITSLVHRAFQHYIARIGRPPAPMDTDYASAIDAGTVWVAESDGHIRAVLVMHDHTDHVLIDNLAVDPSIQGAGVGSQLLQFAEQRARDLAVAEVRLSTNEKMTENLAYYPRRGYREVGRGQQAGFARVHFSKRVHRPVDC